MMPVMPECLLSMIRIEVEKKPGSTIDTLVPFEHTSTRPCSIICAMASSFLAMENAFNSLRAFPLTETQISFSPSTSISEEGAWHRDSCDRDSWDVAAKDCVFEIREVAIETAIE